MNNWIFACGREAVQSLSDVTGAGARALALAGAAAVFAPPQKIFISESDGSEVEWLGKVTQATSSTLAFSRPLHLSKNSGALLWRPASSLELAPEAILPERRILATGVTAETTPGGAVYAIRTAQPQTQLRLRLDDIAPATEDALIAWLAAQTNWGLDAFTLVEPAGAISIVRFTNDPILQERDAQGRRRVILTLLVVQEGGYQ